jgi:hypothetical protein
MVLPRLKALAARTNSRRRNRIRETNFGYRYAHRSGWRELPVRFGYRATLALPAMLALVLVLVVCGVCAAVGHAGSTVGPEIVHAEGAETSSRSTSSTGGTSRGSAPKQNIQNVNTDGIINTRINQANESDDTDSVAAEDTESVAADDANSHNTKISESNSNTKSHSSGNHNDESESEHSNPRRLDESESEHSNSNSNSNSNTTPRRLSSCSAYTPSASSSTFTKFSVAYYNATDHCLHTDRMTAKEFDSNSNHAVVCY